jgi:hypothetical protein
MERLTENLWRELPKGVWFAANGAFRTISAGSGGSEVEAVIVYDFTDGSVAIATVFRTKDWADRDELAAYETGLERLGVPLLFGDAHDDTLRAHGRVLLRTRFVIGDPTVATLAELRDSQSDPELLVHQIEERLSRL